jgi:poly(A) polymerase
MVQSLLKNAQVLCKSIMRNGYDAYVVNTALQAEIVAKLGEKCLDIACDAPLDELQRLFPGLEKSPEPDVVARYRDGDIHYRFYPSGHAQSSVPQLAIARMTPHILQRLLKLGPLPPSLHNPFSPSPPGENGGFLDFDGAVRLEGIPDETLWRANILGVRAMRYAANLDMPIDPATWIAIVRAAPRILDYVPASDIMDEWRKVQPECMWRFVQYLLDSQVMHGLIPEVSAMALIRQTRGASGEEEDLLSHTINCMRNYPKGEFAYDWLGTFTMLLHDIGKIITAEHYAGAWTFFQHHQAGARLARQIMRRLHAHADETDRICHLIRHHMRLHFMLTDKGVRRFMALEDTPRLIQMARADAEAHEDNYTAFNHNMKYLARAETPEAMLKPFLNGNEIMEHTGLKPGPHVGSIRDALLEAQKRGEVTNSGEAVSFVCAYAGTML